MADTIRGPPKAQRKPTVSELRHRLPYLAKSRPVMAVELQAHGRTPDVDRPLTVDQLADDVVAVLRHPDLVDRLVLASVTGSDDGFHPGLLDGIQGLEPAHLVGSPFHDEYLRTAPDPDAFAALVEKVKILDGDLPRYPAEEVRAIRAQWLVPMIEAFLDADTTPAP